MAKFIEEFSDPRVGLCRAQFDDEHHRFRLSYNWQDYPESHHMSEFAGSWISLEARNMVPDFPAHILNIAGDVLGR